MRSVASLRSRRAYPPYGFVVRQSHRLCRAAAKRIVRDRCASRGRRILWEKARPLTNPTYRIYGTRLAMAAKDIVSKDILKRIAVDIALAHAALPQRYRSGPTGT